MSIPKLNNPRMKKTITFFLLFFISQAAHSDWQYGQSPFSTSAPYLSTLPSSVQNKVPKTTMMDSMQFPIPTNRWFQNMILKQGTFPSFNYDASRMDVGAEKIFPFPYLVRFSKPYADQNITYSKLFGWGYCTPAYQFSNYTALPSDTSYSITWLSDVYYYFGTLDSASISNAFVSSYDDLSVNVKWRGTGGSYMRAPVVRGMPYFTMEYNNLRPLFTTPGTAMLKVNGQTISAGPPIVITNAAKFTIEFAGAGPNNQVMVMYASSPITMSFGLNSASASTAYTGYLRMAYVTTMNADPNFGDMAQRIALLDAYAKFVPTGGTVSSNVTADTTVFNFNFNYTTNSSSDSLLMMALPHHQDMMQNPMTQTMKYKCLRGDMKEVYGKTWNMRENMIPNYGWNWTSNLSNVPNDASGKWYDSLYSVTKEDLDSTIGAVYQIPAGNNQPTTSPYGFGKNVTRMARAIVIGDELIERYNAVDPSNFRKDSLTKLTARARDTLYGFLTRYSTGVNMAWNPPPPSWSGGQNNKLIWDQRYGGVISYLGWMGEDNTDPYVYNFDFGNARYNDHAFHYGYMLYAAAVVAKKKTLAGNTLQAITDLARDIGNPSYADPHFTPHRHKDWYDGNSWMNGLQCQAAGRDQESVSEAANAYYGLYTLGLALNNENMKNTGKLMLAAEVRSFKKYYRAVQQTNPNYGDYTNQYLVVGNMWHSLIQNQTYGKVPRFIYGVHMLPKNPFINQMWDGTFANEVWNKVYTTGAPSSLQKDLTLFTTPFNVNSTGTITIATYNMPVQAISAPLTAYNYFQQYRGFSGYFDDGTSKSDCFYLILIRRFAPTGIELQSVSNEIPEKFELKQNYPNPFNPSTTIEYSIPKSGNVSLKIVDISGREIENLVNQNQSAGSYRVILNTANYSSGVYFYILNTEGFEKSMKMIMVK